MVRWGEVFCQPLRNSPHRNGPLRNDETHLLHKTALDRREDGRGRAERKRLMFGVGNTLAERGEHDG